MVSAPFFAVLAQLTTLLSCPPVPLVTRYYLSGTTASVLPSGANTFGMVSSWGFVFPASIRAIIGCFTPLSSSNSISKYSVTQNNSKATNCVGTKLVLDIRTKVWYTVYSVGIVLIG